MNVLQLVPKLNVGGVEKGTIEVARYLTLNGHKAVIVSGGGIMEKDIVAIGARHYKLDIGKKNLFTMIYCYFKLKEIIKKENIDLVHARSRIPAITGYFAARVLRKTFITTAHGQYRKHLISRVMGWGKIVIAANETMARYMKDNFDVPLRKIVIIPRGVDLKAFSFKSPQDKKTMPFRVGMICRFTALKGHLDFLKAVSYAVRKVPSMEAVIMGDKASAKEDYLKKINLTRKRLLLENVVEIKDSDSPVPEVLDSLNIFVSANQAQEAFGRSIIEAQAKGVPVVATRIGGVVENISDNETGLFCDPMDPSDMSDKIVAFARDREMSSRVAAAARKYVEDNYSLEKVMKMTAETYSDVLARKNILVFKISSLGDIILAVPSLRAIRTRFPRANIKVLVDVKLMGCLNSCPYIDETITCDLNSRDKGMGFLKLAGRLRSEDFDISVDLQNNRASHLLSFLSFIPERYGYDNGKLSFLINRKISMPKEDLPPVKHQSYVLGLLGITSLDGRLELWESEESRNWADSLVEESWIKKDQKLIALSLSASKKWATKNWGVNNMAKLADMMAAKYGARAVLIGAPEDRDIADEFIRKTDSKPINAVGRTDISQMISLIKKCNALVTGDSAPMHVAASVGTPFVTLFGPTDPKRHVPDHGIKEVLYKNVKCSPCYKSVCSRRLKCMTSITPEEVFCALEKIVWE